jgi:hypothetical protein
MRFSTDVRRPLGLRARTMMTAVLAACLGALSFSSAASAAPHSPTGEYVQFADCPLSNPAVTSCIYSLSTSGSFTLGAKTVPIKNPVTLQGGLKVDETTGGLAFVGAEDGNTLSKTPQPVPGGLLGITAPSWWPSILRNFFNEVVINQGATGVNATVELAAPASQIKLDLGALLSASGPGLTLPVKIKLDNAFLGSNCYVGSNSNPVKIEFTSGTTSPPPPNTPITGNPGTLSFNGAGTITTLSGGRLVNNTFAAPGANGCGGLFSFLVDPFVNSIVGLPAASGRNTAILEGKIQLAEFTAVKESEP